MILKKGAKWYVSESYLELFNPEKDCIIALSHAGLDKIWLELINDFVPKSASENPLYLELISFLYENGYADRHADIG